MKYSQVVVTNINKGKNCIFYKEDVYPYYEELKEDFNCVYLNEPVPIKRSLLKILDKISDDNLTVLSRMTNSDLKELLIQKLNHQKLVIAFNHFERLTKKVLEIYEYLNSVKYIVFVASFSDNFNKEAYPFFKKFIIINPEKYEPFNKKDEINVTYALYFLVGIICFALYLKLALSMCTVAIFFSVITMGALWFGFLVFRTLIFAGGKV